MSLSGADTKFFPFAPHEFVLVIENEKPLVQDGISNQAQAHGHLATGRATPAPSFLTIPQRVLA